MYQSRWSAVIVPSSVATRHRKVDQKRRSAGPHWGRRLTYRQSRPCRAASSARAFPSSPCPRGGSGATYMNGAVAVSGDSSGDDASSSSYLTGRLSLTAATETAAAFGSACVSLPPNAPPLRSAKNNATDRRRCIGFERWMWEGKGTEILYIADVRAVTTTSLDGLAVMLTSPSRMNDGNYSGHMMLNRNREKRKENYTRERNTNGHLNLRNSRERALDFPS